jgi:ABC-type Mn2+/Zn2+ transport system ATPase subunit
MSRFTATGTGTSTGTTPQAAAAVAAPPLVVLSGVTFGYGGRAVVRADALCLRHGRCVGVFGPNGSGKTTLVRGVTGLLKPVAGTVCRNDPPGTGRRLRFGYLPQYRAIDAGWPMSGADAAALAVAAGHPLGWVGRASRERVAAAMRRLDVEPLACRSFAALSGGQQQRLLLAGALAADPDVLVLDEPTDGLDVRSRASLLALIRELCAGGLCAAVISHDVEDLLAVADEVARVHPADDLGAASQVEVMEPRRLADQILSARRDP